METPQAAPPAEDLRRTSRPLLDGRDRAPARSMLKAIGFNDEDLRRPIVGVAHSWIETMPCNFGLRRLGARVLDLHCAAKRRRSVIAAIHRNAACIGAERVLE